jgi:DDE superfamily endonuclease
VKGTRSCTNAVLHPWMHEALLPILAALPAPEEPLSAEEHRRQWARWQEGLTIRITLPSELPRLRLLLVMDNLTGHRTPSLVLWLFAPGVMPLYTPLGGSWLNMCESIQRILKRRGLDGQHPQTPDEIINWLEAAARGWNAAPTSFEWGGKRALRRQRSRERRHKVGGSYAFTHRPLRRARTVLQQWRQA